MQRFGLTAVPHALLARIAKTPQNKLCACVERYCNR